MLKICFLCIKIGNDLCIHIMFKFVDLCILKYIQVCLCLVVDQYNSNNSSRVPTTNRKKHILYVKTIAYKIRLDYRVAIVFH